MSLLPRRVSRAGRSLRLVVVVLVLVASSVTLAGCGRSASPSVGGSPPLASAVVSSPLAAIPTAVAGTTQAPTASTGDAPPVASLGVEGGDPVAGQLGTYIWADGGSDSAWLPGTPLTVGSGERLILTMAPDVPLRSWRARYTAVRATDPTGAKALLEGVGQPTFAPPPAGTWTVEVALTFAGGGGSASYFWEVTVTP